MVTNFVALLAYLLVSFELVKTFLVISFRHTAPPRTLASDTRVLIKQLVLFGQCLRSEAPMCLQHRGGRWNGEAQWAGDRSLKG